MKVPLLYQEKPIQEHDRKMFPEHEGSGISP